MLTLPIRLNIAKGNFWSFNNETLTPDIKYSNYANPSITVNNGIVPTSFGAGFVYEEYAAGKAVNFLGPREILIKFPIKEVLSIKRLGFDVTGSATGPKDFELYYSLDEGDNYQTIELVNQFVNVAANSKSSFTYDLESLNLRVMNCGSKWG
ncbi:hypothetical protein EDC17_100194 [Sphingobacterium alimentarium]|uniref:F5/8 type C domain-containing protein n=1 Tax=Sphingobacterium alimentarium TaxID=797292 RepID=A0A4R3W341_9SPHI|nr:hypothetical protein [Sphingobacterium alimentarium]TCV20751.1 hypothetical protein EDC17_100194 [Sphingobacterium alimentarium]